MSPFSFLIFLFLIQVFVGNKDRDNDKRNIFDEAVQTTDIIIRPTAWNDHISMRFEILGFAGVFHLFLY